MSDSSSATKSGPFEEQRRIFELLSQETRHLILQTILGHPAHLASLDELEYMIPKSKAAISDQVDNLVEAGILDLYPYEPSEDKRDLPSKFYGPTERGIEILYEYNYLRGVPVARSLHKNTRKSEKIKRHENAPRPTLPESVRDALVIDENAENEPDTCGR
ncbi:ArsR family transcriptional regulator [Haladaptatus sp. NG-WS-4]